MMLAVPEPEVLLADTHPGATDMAPPASPHGTRVDDTHRPDSTDWLELARIALGADVSALDEWLDVHAAWACQDEELDRLCSALRFADIAACAMQRWRQEVPLAPQPPRPPEVHM
jgi:hypothetical protein